MGVDQAQVDKIYWYLQHWGNRGSQTAPPPSTIHCTQCSENAPPQIKYSMCLVYLWSLYSLPVRTWQLVCESSDTSTCLMFWILGVADGYKIQRSHIGMGSAQCCEYCEYKLQLQLCFNHRCLHQGNKSGKLRLVYSFRTVSWIVLALILLSASIPVETSVLTRNITTLTLAVDSLLLLQLFLCRRLFC